MLTVTTNAKKKFKKLLQKQDSDKGFSIRITHSTSKKNTFEFILDKEKESDQVVKSEEGINILLIGNDVASTLEGKTIDYHETPEGAGFSIS